jgi:YgjP-like, metallopeptidase domain
MNRFGCLLSTVLLLMPVIAHSQDTTPPQLPPPVGPAWNPWEDSVDKALTYAKNSQFDRLSSGRVLLNPDLIRAPVPCIDYVITHELVHFVHPNHGPKFYKLLEALMPDWLSRKARLEQILS